MIRFRGKCNKATWGRQGRDYLHLLDEFDDTSQRGVAMARTEAFVSPWPDNKPPTRLQRIQHALFDLLPAPDVPDPVAEDDSLRLVSCHTALREVEVLHDQLLAWLDADASLQPQDIMVMVPDMESFAAVIHAAFGRHRETLRHIPYSVADASPRRLPVLQAVEQLLHLPESRLTLSDWLGLFEVAAVRARFKLTEADVALLRSALEAAVVRWGRDAQQRSTQLGLPADIVRRYNAVFREVLADPEVRELLAKQGTSVVTSTPEELDRLNREEFEKLSKLIKDAGIKGD